MSIKKEIYKTIGDLLTGKLINLPGGLPDLQWFDKQMGQFDTSASALAIPLPAILMEYGAMVWQTTGANNQKGSGNIKFTIYYENYANSFQGSPEQDLALQSLDFTAAVHEVLQGFGINNIMSALTRVGDTEDTVQDMVIVSTIQYSTYLFDHSTDLTRNYIDIADPDLVVEYKDESSRPELSVQVPPFLT